MIVSWGSAVLLPTVLFLSTVWGQDVTTDPPDFSGEIRRSNFITPERSDDDDVDKFTNGDQEYLIIDKPVPFKHAMMLCHGDYKGDLALLKTVNISSFLGEALSETRLNYDTVWVAGLRKDYNSTWKWQKTGDDNQTENISRDIELLMEVNEKVNATDRLCLGFGRKYHVNAQFRPLVCDADRGFICERPRGGGEKGNSTHKGWIKIEKRLYKIFNELVPYETADLKCNEYDNQSNLAVVETYKHAQQLGRYLLIGRPSLENAWIGARWMSSLNQYSFEAEPIVLGNMSADKDDYPPWRDHRMSKPDGCVLLDRHLTNYTLFVEARCERLRAYICYKPALGNDSVIHTDIIINDDGYRLIYTPMNWYDARDMCKVKYAKYNSLLVEITEAKTIENLLYVMGENKTAVQHIWIGGRYNESISPPHWVWDSTDAQIPWHQDADIVLDWVVNATFTQDVEIGNTCLNMDRENHIKAIHYGTGCTYEQSFVCYFSAEELKKLQEDEKAAI